MNNKNNLKKRWIALGVTLAVVAVLVFGGIQYLNYRNDQKTVEVVPLTYVASTYWGDQTSCSGNIVSDYIQELYPDSTKTISEVFVQEGQTVKVGDPLLQYDRTSLELDVESKQVAVEQVKVKIEEAQRQLKKYQKTKPYSTPAPTRKPTTTPRPTARPTAKPTARPTNTPRPTAKPTATPAPTPTPFPTPDPGVHVYKELTAKSIPYKGLGTTENPYVFLCTDNCTMTKEFLQLLWGLEPESTPSPEPTLSPTPEPTQEPDQPTPTPEPVVSDPTTAPDPTASPEPTEAPQPDPTQEPDPTADPQPTPDSTQPEDSSVEPAAQTMSLLRIGGFSWAKADPEPEPSPDPLEESQKQDEDFQLRTPFAAVFEVREYNSNYGRLISSFTLDGTKLSGAMNLPGLLSGIAAGGSVVNQVGVTMPQPKAATPTPAPTKTPSPTVSPDNYNHMNYSSEELKQLIKEKKQEITGLQLDLKQAQLNLDKSKRSLENSTVVSTVDGQVRSLTDLETALANSQPFMVVTGQQQYYVSAILNENLLGSVHVGDTVDVNSWASGQQYTAQIVAISDYPTDNSWWYDGISNPNSSNYEFTAVLLDPDDNIRTGSGVDVTLSVGAEEIDSTVLYLPRSHYREDDAGCYVMKAGKNNRLVKQYVELGKSIWGGECYEIKSGLTAEDFIAFPYGTDVKEGTRVLNEETSEPPFPDGAEEDEAESSDLESHSSLPEGDQPSEDSGSEEGEDSNGEGEDAGGVMVLPDTGGGVAVPASPANLS